jgi:hypothetical protein
MSKLLIEYYGDLIDTPLEDIPDKYPLLIVGIVISMFPILLSFTLNLKEGEWSLFFLIIGSMLVHFSIFNPREV